MEWGWYLLVFLLGGGAGYVLHWRLKGPADDSGQLRRELEQARFELDQQRQEVADYFEQSRELMVQLGQSLDKANTFWNESAQGMLGDGQLLPVAPTKAAVESDQTNQPNDYVQGSHGIIGNNTRIANG